jgi:hypothetical protein
MIEKDGDYQFEGLNQDDHKTKPKGYLLIHNVSKDKNVGMLVR